MWYLEDVVHRHQAVERDRHTVLVKKYRLWSAAKSLDRLIFFFFWMLQRCSYWFWLSFIFNYYDREMVESCACRRMSDSALCLWEACLWLVTLEMGVRYTLHVSYVFFSLHFLPSCFLFHMPLYSLPFLFSISMFPSSHPSFPSLFQMLFSNSLSRILPSSAVIHLSHTIRLVSLPEQLQFKRCQSCFSANCLWSSFTVRSADEASSRKIS